MATRKPAKSKKKKKAAAKKPTALGNDPFSRGSAVREVKTAPAPTAAAPRPETPELQVKRPVLTPLAEKPATAPTTPAKPSAPKLRARTGSLTGRPAPTWADDERAAAKKPVVPTPRQSTPKARRAEPSQASSSVAAADTAGPRAHASSPTVTVDPKPHADAPTVGARAHASSPKPHADAPTAGPRAHASSPSLSVDPKPHADAPTVGPRAHASSPTLSVDPKPHADAPIVGPRASSPSINVDPRPHASSPSLSVDPKPHADAPTVGPRAHASSPTVAVDPQPHAHAPTVGPRASGPRAHASSPTVTVDPQPHPDAPTVGPRASGPRAHASSPAINIDPLPHPGAPTVGARPSGPRPHASSPSVSVDPQPHPGAPTAEPVRRRPEAIVSAGAELPTTTPTIGDAVRGLARAVRTAVGLSSRTTEVDRWGKDTELASSLRPLGDLLYDKYWRVQVEGAEHLPSGPFIIVANHAGALPLDGPVLHVALRRHRPDLPDSRWLLEDQIFHAPFVGVLANRVGAVRANPENALRLLDEGRPLIVFPEGFHGLSKPFSERYQLRRFGRGGYVKIALRRDVPIVPAAIIGGEESMPLLGKLPGGFFGVEYLPVTLPPLPARWHIRFAPPVSLVGAPAEPEADLAWVERTNLGVRDQIEAMLTDMLQHRDRVF